MKRAALAKLFRDNPASANGLRVENAADEATIYIYDYIGFGGVEAESFVRELAALGDAALNVRINSPGGDVMDARAMQTALAAYKGKVTAYVDGLAASAATFVATAAAEIEIAPGGMWMVHNAWTLAMGNATHMVETGAWLEQIDNTIVADYMQRTGRAEEDVRAWMAAETWFTGAEALDAGFVDRVSQETQAGASARAAARWNLSAYDNAPDLAPPPPEAKTFDRAANLRRLELLEKLSA